MRLIPIALLASALAAFVALPLAAQDDSATDSAALSVVERWRDDPTLVFDASEVDLDDLRYLARPLIVFAESPNQPALADQMQLLVEGASDLARRNVIVIVDTDPDARSDARQTLRPRGFSLVLVDIDGTIVFRKPEPWDAREIGRQIDKLPSRLREIGG